MILGKQYDDECKLCIVASLISVVLYNDISKIYKWLNSKLYRLKLVLTPINSTFFGGSSIKYCTVYDSEEKISVTKYLRLVVSMQRAMKI